MMQLRHRLTVRFPWMSARHPVVQRELSRVSAIPRFFMRLTEVRSILGYAALIHLACFAASMLLYSQKGSVLNAFLAPFLTPFGLPLAAAGLHSLLYWVMLMGLGNMLTVILCRDMNSRSWQLLRMTPISTSEIMLAKMNAVRIVWRPILVALIVMRMLASLALPLTSALESHNATTVDYINLALFVFQPVVDSLLALSLSALSATLLPHPLWSRLLTYVLLGLVLGGIGLINTMWLMFTSMMGPISGLLTPLGHWSLLAVAITPSKHPENEIIHLAVLGTLHVIIPLVVAVISFNVSVRAANQRM